jgi:hypothetical protein
MEGWGAPGAIHRVERRLGGGCVGERPRKVALVPLTSVHRAVLSGNQVLGSHERGVAPHRRAASRRSASPDSPRHAAPGGPRGAPGGRAPAAGAPARQAGGAVRAGPRPAARTDPRARPPPRAAVPRPRPPAVRRRGVRAPRGRTAVGTEGGRDRRCLGGRGRAHGLARSLRRALSRRRAAAPNPLPPRPGAERGAACWHPARRGAPAQPAWRARRARPRAVHAAGAAVSAARAPHLGRGPRSGPRQSAGHVKSPDVARPRPAARTHRRRPAARAPRKEGCGTGTWWERAARGGHAAAASAARACASALHHRAWPQAAHHCPSRKEHGPRPVATHPIPSIITRPQIGRCPPSPPSRAPEPSSMSC